MQTALHSVVYEKLGILIGGSIGGTLFNDIQGYCGFWK